MFILNTLTHWLFILLNCDSNIHKKYFCSSDTHVCKHISDFASTYIKKENSNQYININFEDLVKKHPYKVKNVIPINKFISQAIEVLTF